MRKTLPGLFAVLLLCIVAGCSHQNAASSATPHDLVVMTYNLRFASNTPPNAWPQRRPVMRDHIRSVDPDLFGTQEGVYQQLKDMAADLPKYDWIGLGRDGGSHGEFMAIFYKRDRFEPLEYDHFWLSDTPNVIASSTWGNSNRRMVTWVRFKDRKTGQEFYHLNTHLDHQIQPAREKGSALIVQKIGGLKSDLPLILTGDFNAPQITNKAHTILTEAGLTDTWLSAPKHIGPNVGTFHGYKPATPDGEHIDWILVRGPIEATASQVSVFQENGQYPSDHFPVVAWLKFKAAQ